MPYSEDELIENLCHVASQVEGNLTRSEYLNHEDHICSRGPFDRVFGGWNEAKMEAGLRVGKPDEVSRQELLSEVQRVAEEVRDSPRLEDMEEHGKYSQGPYFDYFDSWTKAVEAAGLEPYENPEPYVEIECEYCGENTRRLRSTIKDVNSPCCSEECRIGLWCEIVPGDGENHPLYEGGGVVLECENCGGEYTRGQYNADRSRFCGEDCKNEWMSENLRGEDNPNYSGGHEHDRGPLWNKIAERVRERDKYTCQDCGKSQGKNIEETGLRLQAHHIQPIDTFDSHEKANRLENLVALCHECHPKWNDMYIFPKANRI